MRSFSIIVCLSLAIIAANAEDIDKCLKDDSISCIQRNLYRKAKEFFDKDSLELLSGVTLVKSADRNSRSNKQVIYDQEIDSATNVIERQSALENFVGDGASEFLSGRSLRVNDYYFFYKLNKRQNYLEYLKKQQPLKNELKKQFLKYISIEKMSLIFNE